MAVRPSLFCAGKFQSDYFPLAVGFFAAGALVAFAAPVFALVDLVALVALAAPVFAFVDFGAAGLAAVVALVDFAAVLFAAIPIFLHEESVAPEKFAGCPPVPGTNNREYSIGRDEAKQDPSVPTSRGYR